MDIETVRKHLNDLFEELALLLGGIVAVHPVQNETVWAIVRGLDRLRHHAIDKIEAADVKPFDHVDEIGPEPHPAIEQFLKNLREERRA